MTQQFTGMSKNQAETTSVGQIDTRVTTEQKPGVKEATAIVEYLKEFNRKDYETHTIEENENEALSDFKREFHKLMAIKQKNNLEESDIGLTKENINDFEFISIQ